VTLKMLIQEAYDFRGPNADDMVVAGPKWITSERFTIETKAEEPATVAGMRAIGTAGFDVATSKAGVCDWGDGLTERAEAYNRNHCQRCRDNRDASDHFRTLLHVN